MSIRPIRLQPHKTRDELLKAVFEGDFSDFLRFMYPQADAILA